MKTANFIISFLMISLILSLASCEDEFERTSTHTDVSGMVGGTYTGTISLNDVASFDNVTITIEKYGADTVQAVSVTIKSSAFNYNGAGGLDLPAFIDAVSKVIVKKPVYLNVAKANDGYSFSCANSEAMRLNGRLNGNDLFMQVPILVFGGQAAFHANGDDWMFYGTKN